MSKFINGVLYMGAPHCMFNYILITAIKIIIIITVAPASLACCEE